MSIIAKQKEKLASRIRAALQKAVEQGDLPQGEYPEVQLEIPREKGHGDFASNIALMMAKSARKAPRDVANIIVKHLADEEYIRDIQVAGPGFINFFISTSWLYDLLATIESEGSLYGTSDIGKGENVLIEFVSANPVGPLNVVNARAAAIGDTLARLFRAIGCGVGTEFYVNDAGNQAEVFARSLEARLRQFRGEDVAFPEDGYPGEYIMELAKTLHQENPDLLKIEQEERLAFLKRWGTDKMVAWQKADLETYGVQFDTWYRERELHASSALEEVIANFKEQGYMYTEDDALWFRSTEFGDDKDRVIIKSDGTYTYVTADIAYHHHKLKRGFTKLIDILGPDHHGYIGRMKAAVQALGYPAESLEVLILQYVALLRNGKQVKMSKRAGEFVTMRDLVDEVGKDAARFFFLMRSPESHLDFDLNLAVEQSSDNPVFYVQYAHARISSIMRQADEACLAIRPATDGHLHALTADVEIDLIKKLAEFPEEVMLAANHREPHRIARYVLDLAAIFHSFYAHCHVLGELNEVRDARLTLVRSVQIVLRNGLNLLGIDAPEKM